MGVVSDEKKYNDIFLKAVSETADSKIDKVTAVSKKTLAENWDELEKTIETVHTKRFNKVLSELPDKEFIRTYLKCLEFFKGKVVRNQQQEEEKPTTQINVQINYLKNEKH